jgi:hypothetical protein
MIPFAGWGATGGKWGRRIMHAADDGANIAGGAAKHADEVIDGIRTVTFRKNWVPAKMTQDSIIYGCEEFAKKVKKSIGGEIVSITPNRGKSLPEFQGIGTGWSHHQVVIKDGRVYDAFTGSKGMTIIEYKKFWNGIEDINFGF